MHTPGAQIDKTMHPAIFSCVHFFTKVLIMLNEHARVGCTGFNSMHPAAKMCIQGAECTLNFEHCLHSKLPPYPYGSLAAAPIQNVWATDRALTTSLLEEYRPCPIQSYTPNFS